VLHGLGALVEILCGVLPGAAFGEKWHVTVDTFQDGESGPDVHAADSVHIEARSTLVLIRR